MFNRHEYELAKHRNTIVQLYVVFIFTLICGIIPYAYTQLLGSALLIALMVAVPLYGLSAPQGSILKSHMRYLNGTIWIGSTLLVIGACLMVYWVYRSGDHSAIMALQERIRNGEMVSESGIYATIDLYMDTNFALIFKSAAICMGPPMFYIVMRIMRGLGCAAAGDHA